MQEIEPDSAKIFIHAEKIKNVFGTDSKKHFTIDYLCVIIKLQKSNLLHSTVLKQCNQEEKNEKAYYNDDCSNGYGVLCGTGFRSE